MGDDVDPINLPQKLSIEATYINQNYTQQVLKPNTVKAFEPNPFYDESAGMYYVYVCVYVYNV